MSNLFLKTGWSWLLVGVALFLSFNQVQAFAPRTCFDSDGGKTYSQEGAVFLTPTRFQTGDLCYEILPNGSDLTVEECAGENCYLQELYCESANSTSVSYVNKQCSQGCSHGSCLSLEDEDSDISEFDVYITAQIAPETEVPVYDNYDTWLSAEPGETIIFTRHIEAKGVVDSAWNWNWNSDQAYLDCRAEPFDSSDLTCTVLQDGISEVSITMFPRFEDGTTEAVDSNKIQVRVGEENLTSEEEPLFGFSLVSSPSGQKNALGDSYLEINNGDRIEFSGEILKQQGFVGLNWEWEYNDSKLSCTPSSKVGGSSDPNYEPQISCQAIGQGSANVKLTMKPVLPSGKNWAHGDQYYLEINTNSPNNPKDEPMLFLQTSPRAQDGLVVVDQGEEITLTVEVENLEGEIGLDYQRSWSFDSDKFTCNEVEGNDWASTCVAQKSGAGEKDFYITITKDKKEYVSNKIKVVKTIPKTLPPAGYEDEVVTNPEVYENPFSDTKTDELEGIAASELYRRGIIGGYRDGEFKGNRQVNRAEAAKFLLLARYGAMADVLNNNKFPDVKEGEWYASYVVAAEQKGIINGYADGYFRPQNTVSTAEFVKMLTLTFDLEESLAYSYTDVNPTAWFSKYVGVAQKYKLFPNRTKNFYPGKLLTRKEIAIAIYQYLKNR